MMSYETSTYNAQARYVHERIQNLMEQPPRIVFIKALSDTLHPRSQSISPTYPIRPRHTSRNVCRSTNSCDK